MVQPSFKLPLFPFRVKFIGIVLIFLSLLFGYLYFLGGRSDFFEVPVFAVATTYMESRFFVFAQTNILDELSAILMITGVLLIAFSKEKREEQVMLNPLRLKALILAAYGTACIWILIFLLFYGWIIFPISSTVFLVFLVVYSVLFRILIKKHSPTSDPDENPPFEKPIADVPKEEQDNRTRGEIDPPGSCPG